MVVVISALRGAASGYKTHPPKIRLENEIIHKWGAPQYKAHQFYLQEQTSGTCMAGACLVQWSVLQPGYIWYMYGGTLSGAVKCVAAWLHLVHAWRDLVWCSEVCCGLVTSGTCLAGPCLVQWSVLQPGYIWYMPGGTLSGAVKCVAAWLQMTKPCQAVPSCSSNIWYIYHVTLLRVVMCNVLQSGHKCLDFDAKQLCCMQQQTPDTVLHSLVQEGRVKCFAAWIFGLLVATMRKPMWTIWAMSHTNVTRIRPVWKLETLVYVLVKRFPWNISVIIHAKPCMLSWEKLGKSDGIDLAVDVANKVILAFVISTLDDCNFLLAGLPDILLVEFMYFAFTRMPGESYCRWLRSLLHLCDIFEVLGNSLVWWLCSPLHWLPEKARIGYYVAALCCQCLHCDTFPIFPDSLSRMFQQ